MIYQKMPVVLLSTLASEKRDSTNHIIAQYILSHQKEIYDIGIKELAELCHVGTGSISRFVREIGLENFSELKEMLSDVQSSFEQFTGTTKELTNSIAHCLEDVADSIDMNQVEKLCDDIERYEKVIVFGMLKAQGAAINLQVDLLTLGKQSEMSISYKEQLSFLEKADRDTLIIIFSYTGSFFEYQSMRFLQKHLKQPKIWMVCGTIKKMPDYVDEVISFSSDLKQYHHPYQLDMAETIIAQEFSKRVI